MRRSRSFCRVGSRLALGAIGCVLAACGQPAAEAGLARRVAALEQRLDAADAQKQRLLAVLREHGIVFRPDPPANAADAAARAIDDLGLALDRLESAKDSQNASMGQSALADIETALQSLRQDPHRAVAALLEKAAAAAPARQAALFECCARIDAAAAAPALLALANASERAPSLRLNAARSLVSVDPAAAVPAVQSLLREPETPPELYLLVHLLGAAGEPEVLPTVEAALLHQDRSVRCHAATALGNFRGEGSVAALAAAALGDEYPAVRTNALRALARVAPAERLREVLAHVAANDADQGVRKVARELAPATADGR